jgi:hypothetical protein
MTHRHQALNRREFLKLLSAGAALAIGGGQFRVVADSDEEKAQRQPLGLISVPPSLMLHSRHRWVLPDILAYLVAAGYEGITYNDLALALTREIRLPEKPILISIDDLSPVDGNPSHAYFAAMKDSLVEFGFKGTYAINTRPEDGPDERQWADIASWVADGIALETHSAHHSNLDTPSFTRQDYAVEIIDSARMIAARTGVPVQTLFTPYGSGYDRETKLVNPQVVTACQDAGIRFVVGIVDGREPLSTYTPAEDVLYVGRVGPGLTDDLAGAQYEIEHWS